MPIKKHIKAQMGSAEINRLNIAYAKVLRMLYLTTTPLQRSLPRKFSTSADCLA
jgi:hypothetical protein